MNSSSKPIIGLVVAVVVLLIAVVGLVAYMAGQRSTSQVGSAPEVGGQAVLPEAPEVGDADGASSEAEGAGGLPAGDDAPSLDPFPQTPEELAANTRAVAAAEAIVTGSEGSLDLDNFGKHGEGGWIAEFQAQSGDYLLLGCSDGWDPQDGFVIGYTTLLRETPTGFEYVTVGQDIPEVATLREAGITPDEYRRHLLPMYGDWPYDGGGEIQDW
jgi:hypothetical protein